MIQTRSQLNAHRAAQKAAADLARSIGGAFADATASAKRERAEERRETAQTMRHCDTASRVACGADLESALLRADGRGQARHTLALAVISFAIETRGIDAARTLADGIVRPWIAEIVREAISAEIARRGAGMPVGMGVVYATPADDRRRSALGPSMRPIGRIADTSPRPAEHGRDDLSTPDVGRRVVRATGHGANAPVTPAPTPDRGRALWIATSDPGAYAPNGPDSDAARRWRAENRQR